MVPSSPYCLRKGQYNLGKAYLILFGSGSEWSRKALTKRRKRKAKAGKRRSHGYLLGG